jgi:hypothetical protein
MSVLWAITAPGVGAASRAVYYTDADSPSAVRPVTVDASMDVRAGPFHRWRGWGKPIARATAQYRNLRTTAVMSHIAMCGGKRQYRLLSISTFQGKRRLGHAQHFVNRACQTRKLSAFT